jgi:hypothetical protein|tara:strand:- start:719 stop:910 length:192 start_codon:yes stop_codon:yes gene_type:complete
MNWLNEWSLSVEEWIDGRTDYRTCAQPRTMHGSQRLDIYSNGSDIAGLTIWFEHELENDSLVL